jgi:hypothetical protein
MTRARHDGTELVLFEPRRSAGRPLRANRHERLEREREEAARNADRSCSKPHAVWAEGDRETAEAGPSMNATCQESAESAM